MKWGGGEIKITVYVLSIGLSIRLVLIYNTLFKFFGSRRDLLCDPFDVVGTDSSTNYRPVLLHPHFLFSATCTH
jgi:hypothetical protein